jgi:hypothetical protein
VTASFSRNGHCGRAGRQGHGRRRVSDECRQPAGESVLPVHGGEGPRLPGSSERAIAGCEGGGKPDELGLRRVRETERFQARLAEVVRREKIPRWLETPNEAFGGLKPLEVIERGEIDRLWNMIFYPESGVAG